MRPPTDARPRSPVSGRGSGWRLNFAAAHKASNRFNASAAATATAVLAADGEPTLLTAVLSGDVGRLGPPPLHARAASARSHGVPRQFTGQRRSLPLGFSPGSGTLVVGGLEAVAEGGTQSGGNELLERIIYDSANSFFKGNPRMLVASPSFSGEPPAPSVLLPLGPVVGDQGRQEAMDCCFTALALAAWREDLGAVEALLARGSDPNAEPPGDLGRSRLITPLGAAAERGNLSIVNALLAAQARPRTESHLVQPEEWAAGRLFKPAVLAACLGHYEVARRIVQAVRDRRAAQRRNLLSRHSNDLSWRALCHDAWQRLRHGGGGSGGGAAGAAGTGGGGGAVKKAQTLSGVSVSSFRLPSHSSYEYQGSYRRTSDQTVSDGGAASRAAIIGGGAAIGSAAGGGGRLRGALLPLWRLLAAVALWVLRAFAAVALYAFSFGMVSRIRPGLGQDDKDLLQAVLAAFMRGRTDAVQLLYDKTEPPPDAPYSAAAAAGTKPRAPYPSFFAQASPHSAAPSSAFLLPSTHDLPHPYSYTALAPPPPISLAVAATAAAAAARFSHRYHAAAAAAASPWTPQHTPPRTSGAGADLQHASLSHDTLQYWRTASPITSVAAAAAAAGSERVASNNLGGEDRAGSTYLGQASGPLEGTWPLSGAPTGVGSPASAPLVSAFAANPGLCPQGASGHLSEGEKARLADAWCWCRGNKLNLGPDQEEALTGLLEAALIRAKRSMKTALQPLSYNAELELWLAVRLALYVLQSQSLLELALGVIVDAPAACGIIPRIDHVLDWRFWLHLSADFPDLCAKHLSRVPLIDGTAEAKSRGATTGDPTHPHPHPPHHHHHHHAAGPGPAPGVGATTLTPAPTPAHNLSQQATGGAGSPPRAVSSHPPINPAAVEAVSTVAAVATVEAVAGGRAAAKPAKVHQMPFSSLPRGAAVAPSPPAAAPLDVGAAAAAVGGAGGAGLTQPPAPAALLVVPGVAVEAAVVGEDAGEGEGGDGDAPGAGRASHVVDVGYVGLIVDVADVEGTEAGGGGGGGAAAAGPVAEATLAPHSSPAGEPSPPPSPSPVLSSPAAAAESAPAAAPGARPGPRGGMPVPLARGQSHRSPAATRYLPPATGAGLSLLKRAGLGAGLRGAQGVKAQGPLPPPVQHLADAARDARKEKRAAKGGDTLLPHERVKLHKWANEYSVITQCQFTRFGALPYTTMQRFLAAALRAPARSLRGSDRWEGGESVPLEQAEAVDEMVQSAASPVMLAARAAVWQSVSGIVVAAVVGLVTLLCNLVSSGLLMLQPPAARLRSIKYLLQIRSGDRCEAHCLKVPIKDIAKSEARELLHHLLNARLDPACFGSPVVKALITYKWRTFARLALSFLLFDHLLYMAIFIMYATSFSRLHRELDYYAATTGSTTTATTTATADGAWPPASALSQASAPDLPSPRCFTPLQLGCYVALVVMTAGYGLQEATQALNSIKSNWLQQPLNLLDVAGMCLMFVILGTHLRDGCDVNADVIRGLCGVEVLILFLRLFYYAMPVPGLGGFVSMVLEVVRDLSMFFMFLGTLFVGFSVSYMVMQPERTVSDVFSTQFVLIFGGFDLASYEDGGPAPTVLFQVLRSIYQILVSIIMLNLLIAIINESYDRIREQEKFQLLRNQATMIAEIEALLPLRLLKLADEWFGGEYLYVLEALTRSERQGSGGQECGGGGDPAVAKVGRAVDSVKRHQAEVQTQLSRFAELVSADMRALAQELSQLRAAVAVAAQQPQQQGQQPQQLEPLPPPPPQQQQQ